MEVGIAQLLQAHLQRLPRGVGHLRQHLSEKRCSMRGGPGASVKGLDGW
jgi:hypothetical protein